VNAPGREDACPACGSEDVQPYAIIIIGAAETYGYQCLDCAATWTVLSSGSLPRIPPGALARARAVKGPAA
jgi:transposase-like protein